MQAAPAFQDGHKTVNGIEMYYQIHGEGEPLVLIHGGGSTIETTFSNIIPHFAKSRKVIAMDLQAHGRTGDRLGDLTFTQDADDVAALLDSLHIEKADVLGFSNGGSTALQLAIRHPAKVRKLVVVAALFKMSGMFEGFFEMMQHASLENMPQPLKEAFLSVNNSQEALQNMHDKDAKRMVSFQDWPDEDVASIEAETLVIVGNRDVVSVEHALETSRLIKRSEILVLPGIHGACLGEICTHTPGSKLPEFTAGMVLEFLNRS